MQDQAASAYDGLHYTYCRPFRIAGHSCEGLVRSGIADNRSELLIKEVAVAMGQTPETRVEGIRNRNLAAIPPDRRRLKVEAGYVDWINIGIATHRDGKLVHQSRPGRRIAMPERAASMTDLTTAALVGKAEAS
ncbi:hypothetical protein [Porphyrobacter sp. GA68]|uniref:hypothetical protein n=1 Tax=Porphyrobacter sp. GA68 TaxID=2883480 RepID=UPI001D181A2F|nr:hypothetical protein [Porphyrobacter sp. GA68]